MATIYKDYVKKVSNYFLNIDTVINKFYNKGNWLDIGSADGERIINLTGDKEVHLLAMDSSDEMISLLKSKNINCLKADISNSYTFKDKVKNKFNTITCLYNVLGHIDNFELRNNTFKNIYNLLEDEGVFIFDVNNRWNIKQYGFLSVFKNIIKDLFKIRKSGDFKVNITLNEKQITSSVHIFNIFEIKKLLVLNKFSIKEIFFVNYKTGSVKENMFGGQILIIAKKHG
jgi:SAM-dependent methyltransferase